MYDVNQLIILFSTVVLMLVFAQTGFRDATLYTCVVRFLPVDMLFTCHFPTLHLFNKFFKEIISNYLRCFNLFIYYSNNALMNVTELKP